MRISPEERLKNILDCIASNQLGEKLVNTFVQRLYTSADIAECMRFVDSLPDEICEKLSPYLPYWRISLEYLFENQEKARTDWEALDPNLVDRKVWDYYRAILGFDPVYRDFVAVETEHFIFHIHPKRYDSREDIRFTTERREQGANKVGEDLFGVYLERKIDYYLWDSAETMKLYLGQSRSQALTGHQVIHEYQALEWHESTHIFHYLYGIERQTPFIFEAFAVLYDGRKYVNKLGKARNAYNFTKIRPDIRLWWRDYIKFRETPPPLAYQTAGYFLGQLAKRFGKKKLLELARYQTFEDACRIYGEYTVNSLIDEAEQAITAP